MMKTIQPSITHTTLFPRHTQMTVPANQVDVSCFYNDSSQSAKRGSLTFLVPQDVESTSCVSKDQSATERRFYVLLHFRFWERRNGFSSHSFAPHSFPSLQTTVRGGERVAPG
ncbi:hypothetical protein XENTR_v10021259 [Xenopus tropicalis]|nr:hypothetical protein XENTR_v10021259 [Xenopus tropicalis]KAE8585259.1 hypothetical protein XENTR_v10021259 [Xenopus tropicalis]